MIILDQCETLQITAEKEYSYRFTMQQYNIKAHGTWDNKNSQNDGNII